jgi:hypothetical protein
MANKRLSQLSLVTTATSADDALLTQSSASVRIKLDKLITAMLALTTPATEAGAEVNDLVNVGGGVDLHTGSKTDSRPQIKTLAEGNGVTLTDSGTLVTIAADATQALRTIRTETGTTYTYALTDRGVYIRHNNASPMTITIPLNSAVAFPVGTEIHGERMGAGTLTVSKTGGVTLNHSGTGTDPTIRQRYGGWTAIKVATDEWTVHGDLTT